MAKETALDLSVADIEAWAALGVGTAAVVLGASRRSAAGWLIGLAAAPLVYRGLTGDWPGRAMRQEGDTRHRLAGRHGSHAREVVELERSVSDVYRFWRQLDTLPSFMHHLEQVSDQGNGRSHWVARGPANLRVEWDAEIINERENQVIGWRSLPGSDIVTAGSVKFESVRDGATRVTVRLQYSPPAGRLGSAIAWLMGRDPSQTLREDLRRLKQLLEAGEIARSRAATRGSKR